MSWFYKNNPNHTNFFSIIVSLTPVCFLFSQNINSFVGTYFLVNILYALFYKKIDSKQKTICVCLISMIVMLLIRDTVLISCKIIGFDQAKWLHYFELKWRGIYCFSIGMVIYCLKPHLEIIKKDYPDATCVATCGSLFASVALIYGFYKYDNWNTVYIMLLVTIIIISQIVRENRLFVNKIVSTIGKYSYAFYYVHIPLVYFLCDKFHSRIAAVTLGFFLSLMLSGIITNFVEKPIILYLNNILKKIIAIKI